MGAGQSIAGDIQHGFFNRLQLTPLRGSALIAGQLAGVTLQGLIQGVAYLVVALAFGADLEAGPAGVAGAVRALGAGRRRVRLARPRDRPADRQRRGGAGRLPAPVRAPLPQLRRAAARPDRERLVPDVATINPVSYLIEGFRSLFVSGWDGEALALAFGVARRRARRSACGPRPRPCERGWSAREPAARPDSAAPPARSPGASCA